MSNSKSYRSVFKATSLLASVKVVTVLSSLIKNKAIAIILGTSGAGIFGILNNSVTLLTSVADLGVNRSSVRSIAESKSSEKKLAENIFVFKRVLFFSSAVIAIFTIVFASYLSQLSFGNSNYTWSFIWLGLAVFITTLYNGELAVLQGLRKLKIFAKVNSLNAILSVTISLPIYYLLGEAGIVPALLITAVFSFILAKLLARSIIIEKVVLGFSSVRTFGVPMIYLGIAMMMVSFMFQLSAFILRTHIARIATIEEVGIFYAGFTIITGYFGMVFTAMSTDFFPRLSAVNSDNVQVQEEVNLQATVALNMVSPLVNIMLILAPFLVGLLFSEEFTRAADYVKWAVLGVVFQVGSQTMGMVLIAKNKARVFIITVFIFQSIFLTNNIVCYNYFGISGLGGSFTINMIIHFIGTQTIMLAFYKVKFSKKYYINLLVVLLIAIISFFSTFFDGYKYIIGSITIVFSIIYAAYTFKKIMAIDNIFRFLKEKMKK